MSRTERKYIEILRILKEHQEPMGAKRLSELMANGVLFSPTGPYNITSATWTRWGSPRRWATWGGC